MAKQNRNDIHSELKTAWVRDRVKPSTKRLREVMAEQDGRSAADWNERLILEEAKRRHLID